MLKAHVALREGQLAVALVKKMRASRLWVTSAMYSHMLLAFCKAEALQVRLVQKLHHRLLLIPVLSCLSFILTLALTLDYLLCCNTIRSSHMLIVLKMVCKL